MKSLAANNGTLYLYTKLNFNPKPFEYAVLGSHQRSDCKALKN